MRPSLRYRAREYVRRHASALAVWFVGLVGLVSVGGVLLESESRRDSDERQRAEALEQICDSIDVSEQALINLIGVVLDDTKAPPTVNLDALPEFRAVDPEVQALIRVLVNGGDADAESVTERLRGFRDGLRATPLPDFCETR